MLWSKEQAFLQKFIFDSHHVQDPTACHTLIVREKSLRLIPCKSVRTTDIQIFRLLPSELQIGMSESRWTTLTRLFVKIKEQLGLNDNGGSNGPEPKNPND